MKRNNLDLRCEMLVEFENLSKINTILVKLEELEAKLSNEKRWLNIKEASNYLGIRKTIYTS